LTYLLQQSLLTYLEHKDLRYQTIAEVLGAIEGVKLDFIERVVKPYEEQKRKDNGDVWPNSLLTRGCMTGPLSAPDFANFDGIQFGPR
jgi:hypothetical protein